MYSDEEDEENPLAGFWLEGDSLAPPCQAELDVVHEIIQLANPSEESVLFDLGCGDGRICLEATKRFGCHSVGIEIEEHLILKFKKLISVLGLADKVTALHEDLLKADLSRANVIVCYLLPEAIELIKCKLEAALRRGVVLICNTWGPKGWKCVQTVQCGQLNSTVNLLMYNQTSIPSTPNEILNTSSNKSHLCASERLCDSSDSLDFNCVYITYCSKEKRHDMEDLPAIDRYLSARIRRVREAATAANCYFMILSGSYGLLNPEHAIPYYDHLLTDCEVVEMSGKVSLQLVHFVDTHHTSPANMRVKYFEVQNDPFVGPYRSVIQRLCEQHSMELEIIPTIE